MILKLITILINLLILTLFSSCNPSKNNCYVFPVKANQNSYFIVNLHTTSKKIKNKHHVFDFTKSNIIIIENDDFIKSQYDKFYKFDGTSKIEFNPEIDKKNSIKLCYYNSVINNGISRKYYKGVFGIESSEKSGKSEKDLLEFDFFYFSVGENCSIDSSDFEIEKNKLYKHILLHELN